MTAIAIDGPLLLGLPTLFENTSPDQPILMRDLRIDRLLSTFVMPTESRLLYPGRPLFGEGGTDEDMLLALKAGLGMQAR